MKRMNWILLMVLVVVVGMAHAALRTERIVYTKKAVYLHLKTGVERSIIFPARRIAVQIDRRIDGRLVTTPLDGTLYLKPLKPFARTRIRVVSQDTGQTYLFDIESSSKGSANVVEILLPKHPVVRRSHRSRQPDLVIMSRFAAQKIYAPRRIVKNDPRFTPVQLNRTQTKRLYRGGDIVAIPIQSWRAGNLYVTAIRLQNVADYSVDLDFRMIRGQTVWKSAVFQHARVGSKGTREDQTFMYLVSDRPYHEVNFEESIR